MELRGFQIRIHAPCLQSYWTFRVLHVAWHFASPAHVRSKFIASLEHITSCNLHVTVLLQAGIELSGAQLNLLKTGPLVFWPIGHSLVTPCWGAIAELVLIYLGWQPRQKNAIQKSKNRCVRESDMINMVMANACTSKPVFTKYISACMWQMMSCHEFVCLSYVSFKLKMFGMRMALPDTIIYFFVCFD